jgi:hypothetical protein
VFGISILHAIVVDQLKIWRRLLCWWSFGEVIVVDVLIDVERKESKKGAVSQRQKRVEERSMNFRSLDTLQPSFCFLSV